MFLTDQLKGIRLLGLTCTRKLKTEVGKAKKKEKKKWKDHKENFLVIKIMC